ncbi:hypothetical protein L1987_32665 [Smallanthus sonchifolius]|uniref:Uncharacterized protein n=1 Tax=Smallanthus sonchifolius TaxID=185202 RepID=A0ACB9HN73_9ASTR|nr:hypothetical protein L1987_32665 [Smallanthus sonchifolius]
MPPHFIPPLLAPKLHFADMKKGSTRFSDATRQTGEGSIVISHKPSKKLKTLSSVTGMDESSSSKRVKFPKKILDDCHSVNLVSVPRKLRSVMKKRYSDPSSPNLTNGISGCEMSSTDGNKKLKLEPDEQQHTIVKDEEEAIAGLLALAGNDNTHEINLKLKNKISDATVSKTEDLVQKRVQIDDLNESRNTVVVNLVKKDSKHVTDGNELRKRCASHVHICQIIKNLQMTKGKTVNLRKEPKTEITPENFKNVNAGINLNESITVSKTVFQDQPSGCGVQSYFGNPFCDPSQWSRPVFPKQQMWMNPLMYKPLQSGSYVQPSLHNVLGSKHHPSSGYDENRVLFRVDSPLTLKLALQ